MKAIVLVLVLCVTRTLSEDDFEKNSYRVALKVYDDCSKGEFFTCLKKKAIVMLDRLGRMEKISLTEGVTIVKAADDNQDKNNSTGEDLERNISKEESLDEILLDKLTRLIGSRRLEISLPKMLPNIENGEFFFKFIFAFLNQIFEQYLKKCQDFFFLIQLTWYFLFIFSRKT